MLQEVNRQLPCPASPAASRLAPLPTSPVLQEASQRVLRRYRKAKLRKIQKKEYLKLRAIVPAVASQGKVSKVTVIEEAIKYIDELHQALADRLQCPAPGSPGFFNPSFTPVDTPASCPSPTPSKSSFGCPSTPDRKSAPSCNLHSMTMSSPLHAVNRIS